MFLHDLRHAFRLLWRDPGFTITAVLTLTLGVGANVAVFAVVNAVLLRPLPYADAERLVLLEHRDRRTGITKEFIAMGDYVDLHAQADGIRIDRGIRHPPDGRLRIETSRLTPLHCKPLRICSRRSESFRLPVAAFKPRTGARGPRRW